jgi:hypothetical protein
MATEITMALDTCKLRYCRPSETDWLVESLTRSEAPFRKQTLEEMGCVVEMIDSPGNSVTSLQARFGGMLDPKRIMN